VSVKDVLICTLLGTTYHTQLYLPSNGRDIKVKENRNA